MDGLIEAMAQAMVKAKLRTDNRDYPDYAMVALAAALAYREPCPECEGQGIIAANFGLQSPGRADIEQCPVCHGSGLSGRRLVWVEPVEGWRKTADGWQPAGLFREVPR